jgi:hypothetical protein
VAGVRAVSRFFITSALERGVVQSDGFACAAWHHCRLEVSRNSRNARANRLAVDVWKDCIDGRNGTRTVLDICRFEDTVSLTSFRHWSGFGTRCATAIHAIVNLS